MATTLLNLPLTPSLKPVSSPGPEGAPAPAIAGSEPQAIDFKSIISGLSESPTPGSEPVAESPPGFSEEQITAAVLVDSGNALPASPDAGLPVATALPVEPESESEQTVTGIPVAAVTTTSLPESAAVDLPNLLANRADSPELPVGGETLKIAANDLPVAGAGSDDVVVETAKAPEPAVPVLQSALTISTASSAPAVVPAQAATATTVPTTVPAAASLPVDGVVQALATDYKGRDDDLSRSADARRAYVQSLGNNSVASQAGEVALSRQRADTALVQEQEIRSANESAERLQRAAPVVTEEMVRAALSRRSLPAGDRVIAPGASTPGSVADIASLIDTGSLVHRPAAAPGAMTGGPLAGTVASAATAATPSFSLDAPFRGAGWSESLGERIVWMSGQKIHGAEIRLNPPELGPLEVKIDVRNDQTQVSFTAHHAAVRDALEAAMPRLREMFSNSGMDLVDVNVSDQPGSERRTPDFRDDSVRPGLALTDEPEAEDIGAQMVVQQVSRGLLDTFA